MAGALRCLAFACVLLVVAAAFENVVPVPVAKDADVSQVGASTGRALLQDEKAPLSPLDKATARVKELEDELKKAKEDLLAKTDEAKKNADAAANAQKAVQERDGMVNTLRGSLDAKTKELENLQNSARGKDTELAKVKDELKVVQNQLEILNQTLQAAEEVIKNPSIYDYFDRQVSKAMVSLPYLAPALNDTLSYVGAQAYATFKDMKTNVKGKVSKYPTISHHASLISEVAAYTVFCLPLIACYVCICSGRLQVSVHHLCVFGNVFFLGVSATLFMFSLVINDGVYDPFALINQYDNSKGIYIAVAIVFCLTYLCHLYALVKCRDWNSLVQLVGVVFVGTHYYSKVWYYAIHNTASRMKSPWWYFAYASIFILLSVLSFRRLSWQQQIELKKLIVGDPVADDKEAADEEKRRRREGESLLDVITDGGAGVGEAAKSD
eukprot:tig00000459_g1095.t1